MLILGLHFCTILVMEKTKSKKKDNLVNYLCGVALVVALFLPYIINGQNSVITYHDQLDGEILTYIFNAKYLFTGTDVYPELMNGISKNSLASPAPAMILVYKAFSPFAAFLICLFIAKFTAFSSMYLLTLKLFGRNEAAFIGAMLFSVMPFYSVYGLCIPGIPLVLYSFLLLRDKKYVPAVLHVLFYAANSSLALVGFAMIVATGVITVYELMKNKKSKAFLVPALLTVTYLLFNMNLVMQVVGNSDGFVSHKSEVIYQPMPFRQALEEIFVTGVSYAQSKQVYLMPVIATGLVVLAVWAIKTRKRNDILSNDAAVLLASGGSIVIISAVYITLESAPVIELRNHATGILHDFNFTRFSWLMPVAWVLAFSASINFVLNRIEKHGKKKILTGIFYGFSIICMCFCMLFTIKDSDVKTNVARIRYGQDYHVITWNQFFCEDLFEKVDEYTDDDKSSYRVASIGIYPSIAAYNGYYCLDAYSNNYDVEYKHEFRKIIEKELDKSDYIRQNFDEWGNRCYLMTAKSGYYGLFEKEYMDSVSDLELNYEQMKKMGCRYIFSTHYILNEEENLTLLNDEAVMTNDSWYKLWIYEIK